jgi:hypothetical protein
VHVIELFAVTPEQDEAFLAAWQAEAPPGTALYRALRDDVRLRFAAVPAEDAGGVLLIAAFDDDRFLAHWPAVRDVFSRRQGYIGERMLRSRDGHVAAVVRWSSPLMYARTVREEGDLIAALPFESHAALYAAAPS